MRPLLRAPLILAVVLVGAGCRTGSALRDLERAPSHALAPDPEASLVQLVERLGWREAEGYGLLDRGADSLDTRLALIHAAECTIDVQTYLWHGDRAGTLLLNECLDAADRGVRVRLIIDDFQLEGGLKRAAALSFHENLELRVFNPYLEDGAAGRLLEVLGDFDRLDHRMHDKSMVVDGVVAVAGGRNIGDEYFGLGGEFDFRDLDLVVAGPVVDDLEACFDEFWNSEYAVPVADLWHGIPADAAAHQDLRERLDRTLAAADGVIGRRRAAHDETWVPALERLLAELVPGAGRVVRDSLLHSRGGLTGGGTGLMAAEIARIAAEPGDEVWFVSAYFVPDDDFLAHLAEETARGVELRILTNSLASTNQPLAHAYYAEERARILATGARLHEIRVWGPTRTYYQSPGSVAERLGLHGKAAVYGDHTVVVGSMNLDPRSMKLNTELGLVVESAPLAERTRAALARDFAAAGSWEVRTGEDGGLEWHAGELRRETQPALSGWQRFSTWFLGFLPLRGEV
ncbi:Cardiolipin synthase [Planctomycetes bacterium Pla163]|uniref:Cardiolipin synthase n=1 Tax=Rohdeia mirabilis TaxID=2528008 RepID=A0A518D536_9BACT|nr:Cardiolipin synthase [Planctomycetes bacterium Pla163]